MNKRRVGAVYEKAAGSYYEKNGCLVVARNFRYRRAEIDLIVLDRDVLVFAEVKYRKDGKNGFGAEAVDRWKQRRIAGCAAFFLLTHPEYRNRPCRFDVLAFDGIQMVHYKDAFWIS